MIRPVAEAIEAERTRVLAGAHAHPRGDGDGRDHALQPPVDAEVHQATQVHQALVAENYLWGGAVEAEHADFHLVKIISSSKSRFQIQFHSKDAPSMDSGTAT